MGQSCGDIDVMMDFQMGILVHKPYHLMTVLVQELYPMLTLMERGIPHGQSSAFDKPHAPLIQCRARDRELVQERPLRGRAEYDRAAVEPRGGGLYARRKEMRHRGDQHRWVFYILYCASNDLVRHT
jgi:hypothetical protein